MQHESRCPICGGSEIVYSKLKGIWECLCCGARVYNCALAEEEVRQLYKEAKGGSKNGKS